MYHITLTIPSREPLFGTLVIPENNPSRARIERTDMGNAALLMVGAYATVHVRHTMVSTAQENCVTSSQRICFSTYALLVVCSF